MTLPPSDMLDLIMGQLVRTAQVSEKASAAATMLEVAARILADTLPLVTTEGEVCELASVGESLNSCILALGRFCESHSAAVSESLDRMTKS